MEKMDLLNGLVRRYTRRVHVKRVVALLCVVVLLFTMNSLKFRAVTLERIPTCGLEEHVHDAACYDGGELVCGLEEHVHTDACYQQAPGPKDDSALVSDPVDGNADDEDDVEIALIGGVEAAEDGEADAEEAVDGGAAERRAVGYRLGNSAMVSEIIADQKLPVAMDDIEMVGVVDNGRSDGGLVEVQRTEDDCLIVAARDFEEAELAIMTADDILTVRLVEGRAARAEEPAEPVAEKETPVEPVAEKEEPAEPEVEKEAPAEPAAEKEEPSEPAAEKEAPAEPVAEKEEPAEPVAEKEEPAEPAEEKEEPAGPVAEKEAPVEATENNVEEKQEPAEGEAPAESGEESSENSEESTENEEKSTENNEEASDNNEEEPAEGEEESSENSEESSQNDEEPSENNEEESSENDEESSENEEEPAEGEEEPAYPAQSFTGAARGIRVSVTAGEGAFPEGTKMVVRSVRDADILSGIEQTVGEDFVEVKRVHAVDISFWLGDVEIEPLIPISVVMSVAEVEDRQETVVVHVDDEGEAEVVESRDEPQAGNTDVSVEMPAAPAAEEVAFEADAFSVYAVVVTETIETRYIDASGAAWRITVGYGQDSGIPANARLRVQQVPSEGYLDRAAEALEDGKRVAEAYFFDIAILDADGREIQPAAPVQVSVALERDGADADDVCAMHFRQAATDVVAATETDEAVVFDAAGFSVWGVVYTVDFRAEDSEGFLSLNFTDFDAANAPSEGDILYDTTDCSVRVALSLLGGLVRGGGVADAGDFDAADGEGAEPAAGPAEIEENNISYKLNAAEGFAFDMAVAEKAEAAGGVDLVDGELVIVADGSIDLADGEKLLHVNVRGLSALKEELLKAEGVSIEVVEGSVPLGSEASFEKHGEEKTQELVDYILSSGDGSDEAVEIGETSVTGYSAADLKIVRNEETVPVEGQFRVTVDRESLVPKGATLDKLYHIHDGRVDLLEVEETGNDLVFEMTDFSDIVASYTVEFHNSGRQVVIAGGSQVLLSGLIDGLGLIRPDETAFDVDDVERVEFRDPGLFDVDEVTESPVSVNGIETAFSAAHDFLITSKGPFAETEMILTLTDGTRIVVKVTDDNGTFTSTISFFAADASVVPKTASVPMHVEGTLEAPELTKHYYLLATLYDSDNNLLGWNAAPVAPASDATSVSVDFTSFYRFAEGLDPDHADYGKSTEAGTYNYSSSQNTVKTRLYRLDYGLNGGDMNYNKITREGVDHPEDGYEFGGNYIDSTTGVNHIHIKKSPADKKYYVRVRFDEEAATAFDSGDRYYVNVKVWHASNDSDPSSFQGALLAVNPSSLSVDPATGLHYIDFDFTQWLQGSGAPKTGSNTVFSGNEEKILVELIKQTQQNYQPNYDKNNAKAVPEGTLAKAYRVHYDTKLTNPKDTPTGFYEDRGTDHVYCYDIIDMISISATDDYDFNTILGPNVGYGIVADHLFQGNDLQTNFAVNHYSAHGHYVSPDLSGNSSGAIVIGEFNVVDGEKANGIGEKAYDDTWGRLPVGDVLGQTLIVYADDDTGYNAPDGNVSNIDTKPVVVVHTDGETLKSSMVQPGIDYGIAMSNALMSHSDTFTPADKHIVDTTGFPDGATIYVDGDPLADTMATSGALTIKKLKNQTIVFNFDTTRDLTLTQFKYEQYTAPGTKEFELVTTTDTSQTTKNIQMDEMSRHIVWNLNGVKGKTVIKEGGGIYLQPNRNSEIDIQATSGGWIVSNGFVYNSTAEWHNFFIDMPDTNKLNLRAIKTVDGKIPRAGQKFEFYLKEYHPEGTTEEEKWVSVAGTPVRNTNATVAFPEMRDLSEGWHVFKIHENTTVPTGDGIEAGLYIVDQSEYYALVHVTKTTDPIGGDRYIITPPAYYHGPFDATKFDAVDGASDGAFGQKVSAAAFNNEAVKEGLTIEKKVEGTTDATRRFSFEIELKNAGNQPLTGPISYSVTGIAENRTLTLDENGKGVITLRNGQKATIADLAIGTQYTVRETKVGEKAITSENKDDNGYVDGYATPEEPQSGTIGENENNVSIASFTNVYHASGTVTLTAKKALTNASDGTEQALQAGQFKFTLTPLNSMQAQPETVTNDAEGNVRFTALNFTEADMTGAIVMPSGERVKTLIYYVSESDGELENFNYGNVVYDGTKVVILTLTDDGAGHITAKCSFENFLMHFNNEYVRKAAGTLEGNKKLTGRDLEKGEFKFVARLYRTVVGETTETYPTNETYDDDNNPNTPEKPNPDYVTEAHDTPTKLIGTNEAAVADESGAKPVATGTITFPTVHYLDAGEYYYQITENTNPGYLPMGVTATPATYYARVTVPAVAERTTDDTQATVTYYTDAECTVPVDKTYVIFENEQRNINFTVTKSWTDGTGAAKGEGYSIVFSVKKNGQAYPVTAKHLEVVSGDSAKVEIQNDGTVKLTGSAGGWPVVKIKNVPEATYVVTETAKNGEGAESYNTTYDVGSRITANNGTITEDDTALTIYNTKGEDRYTSITVEKKWMVGQEEYTPEEGSVTFQLTRKENKQVELPQGREIPVMHDNVTNSSTVHVGNVLLISYTVSFGSADAKKAFYNSWGDHKITGIQYGTDASANGDAVTPGGRCTIYLPQPCPLSGEDISNITDNNDIVITFRAPTKGTVDGKTIETSLLKGIKIWSYQINHAQSAVFQGFSEEPGYDTVTTTTTSDFTVDAAHGWRTVLSGLPLSKSSPVTSYNYTVEEIAVNGQPVTDDGFPFTVTYSGDREEIVGGTVVTTNTSQPGALQLKKLVTVNDAAPGAKHDLVDGAYLFTITGPSTLAAENRSTKYVWVIVENGAMSWYRVFDDYNAEQTTCMARNDGYWWYSLNDAGEGHQAERVTGDWITIDNLIPGQYVIQESMYGHPLGNPGEYSGSWICFNPESNLDNVALRRVTGGTSTDLSDRSVTVSVEPGATVAATAQASFTNNANDGELKLKKIVHYGGADPTTDAQKQLLEGMYVFKVTGPTDNANEPLKDRYVRIYINENGVMANYGVRDSLDGFTGDWWGNYDDDVTDRWVTINHLAPGSYTITELGAYPLEGENLGISDTPREGIYLQRIVGGDPVEGDPKSVTVTVPAGGSSAAAVQYTNDYAIGKLGLRKIVEASESLPVSGNLEKADGTYSFTVEGPLAQNGTEYESQYNTATRYVQIRSYHVNHDHRLAYKVSETGTDWNSIPESDLDLNGYVRFEGLVPGYYRIRETGSALAGNQPAGTEIYLKRIKVVQGSTDVTSSYTPDLADQSVVVQVTQSETEVDAEFTNELTPSTPTVKKLVADINDSNQSTGTAYISENPWFDSADHDLTDPIPYRVSGFLPQKIYRSSTSYNYQVVDVMENLHYVAGSGHMYAFVKGPSDVTGSWYDVTSYFVDSTTHDFTVSRSGNMETLSSESVDLKTIRSCALVVGWDATGTTHQNSYAFGSPKTESGHNITADDIQYLQLRYRATFDTTTVQYGSAGNYNDAKIVYSYTMADGSTVSSETPWDRNRVFTYRLQVNKTDESGTEVSGAVFELYKKYYDYTIQSGDKQYSMVDGEVTYAFVGAANRLPADASSLSDASATANVYVPVARTSSGSSFAWNGIDDGEYVLVETHAPDGYQPLDGPIKITISAFHEIDATNPRLTSFTFTPTNEYADWFTAEKSGETTLVGRVIGTVPNIPYKTYKVKKTWGDGQTPPEGAVITVGLTGTANDTSVDLEALGVSPLSVTLDGVTEGDEIETTAWEYQWTKLPKYDGNDCEITYSASETSYMIGETEYINTLNPDQDTETAGYDLVLTNALPTVSVPVAKQWKSGETVLDWWPEETTVTVGLYRRVTGSEDDPEAVTETYTPEDGGEPATRNKTVELTADHQSDTFTELPKYAASGAEYEYSVKETAVTINGTTYSIDGTVKPSDLFGDATSTADDGTITVTNQMNISLKVVKWSKGKTTQLSGAKFQLTRKLPGESTYTKFEHPDFDEVTVDEVTSRKGPFAVDSDSAVGERTISGLLPGDYILQETASPAGYIIMSSPIAFKIYADGTVSVTGRTADEDGVITYTDGPANLVTFQQKRSDAPAEAAVENEPGASLPATGGRGTTPVYAFGAALLLLAAAGLVHNARKRWRGTGI